MSRTDLTGRQFKLCPHCGETKNRSAFGKHKDRADGLQSWCRSCFGVRNKERRRTDPEYVERVNETSRVWYAANSERLRNRPRTQEAMDGMWERRLLRDFGITRADYIRMLDEQNGVCLICKQLEQRTSRHTGKLKRLAVDHCHETGRIRGLLCWRCNSALGKFGDDPGRLRRAARYLEGRL